jgi:hypothetical protein
LARPTFSTPIAPAINRSNLFSNDSAATVTTFHSSLQNGRFYKPWAGWLIDETLFKDFGCADRWSRRRCLRAASEPIVLVVWIPSTCPLLEIGLA